MRSDVEVELPEDFIEKKRSGAQAGKRGQKKKKMARLQIFAWGCGLTL